MQCVGGSNHGRAPKTSEAPKCIDTNHQNQTGRSLASLGSKSPGDKCVWRWLHSLRHIIIPGPPILPHNKFVTHRLRPSPP